MKKDWTFRMDMGFEPYEDKETQNEARKEMAKIWPESSRKAWEKVVIKGKTETDARAALNDLILNDTKLGLRECIKDDEINQAKSIEAPIKTGVVWRPVGNLHISIPGGGMPIVYTPKNDTRTKQYYFKITKHNVTCQLAFNISAKPAAEEEEGGGGVR